MGTTDGLDTRELLDISPLLDDKEFQTPSSVVRMEFGALSHVGKVRPNNEDHYLITRLYRGQETLFTNLPEGEVPLSFQEHGYGLVVADGMGGAARGDVASSLAISTLVHLALHFGKWNVRINKRIAEEVKARIQRFYQRIGEVVTEEGEENPDLSGMGTTLTGAFIAGTDLFVASVGDSRAYLFRDARLRQLTHDQTYAQMLADVGQIPQTEVSTHHLRHVLTDVIGAGRDKVNVQISQLSLLDGDSLLLCTDGLTEMVEEELIAGVLVKDISPQAVCEELVNLALEHGGKDNVTVLFVKYHNPA